MSATLLALALAALVLGLGESRAQNGLSDPARAGAALAPTTPNGTRVDSATIVQAEGARVQIRITIGAANLAATLEDNPTARDFAVQLPLTVTLRDFGAAEKVSGELPKRISEQSAPATAAGTVGDIAYYAPWGNIAFYRERGPNASGVIKIATITSGIEALDQPGQLHATISRAD